jgi:hypothetical protein
VGGPPAGATGKQLDRGKVLTCKNTDDEEEENEETSPQKNQTKKMGAKSWNFLLLSCLCCNYTPQYPILMDRSLHSCLRLIPQHATSIVGKWICLG